ncbi:MAG: hypothetical protein Q4B40_05755 [Clostridia bacterium]|nr:hypothetical protein [Clostridia bacterium]
MNYIVLEGISLCVFLSLIALLFILCVVCLINTAIADKRNYVLNDELKQEKEKSQLLLKHIFRLKLIYGDFDIDD